MDMEAQEVTPVCHVNSWGDQANVTFEPNCDIHQSDHSTEQCGMPFGAINHVGNRGQQAKFHPNVQANPWGNQWRDPQESKHEAQPKEVRFRSRSWEIPWIHDIRE